MKPSCTSRNPITQAPILHFPDPNKRNIVYTDASDNTCRVELSQEHNGTEFPIAFLLHTFPETQRKWSMTEQEAYGVLLCHYKMELLSPRSRYHSQELSQTTHQIFKWKEYQQQG